MGRHPSGRRPGDGARGGVQRSRCAEDGTPLGGRGRRRYICV